MKKQVTRTQKKQESGYALLAMLAGLTIALVILAAAASRPTAQFVAQRENEEEMMFRALQVANAIQSYATIKGGGAGVSAQNLPTKIEDLTKEMTYTDGKGAHANVHLLRPETLVDPLTNDEWKPVRLGDPMVRDFVRAYMQEMTKQQTQAMASGGGAAAAVLAQQQQQAQSGAGSLPPLLMLAVQAGGIDLNKLDSSEEEAAKSTRPGLSSLDSDSRPIIGVISKSKKQLIRNYYGIESYDKALFVAGAQPSTLNYTMPIIGGGPALPTDGSQVPGSPPSIGKFICTRDGPRDPRCGPSGPQ